MIGSLRMRAPLAAALIALASPLHSHAHALTFRTSGVLSVQAPVRQTATVFRLGGPDAPDEYAFPEPPQLVVDDAGCIYARVASDGAVSVFDADGRFVRSIGRKGEGPGEFQFAFAHGLLGDTLWVINWPTPRVSRFLTDGSHVATERAPFDYGHSFGGPVGLDALLRDGQALVKPPSPVLGVSEPILLPVVLGPAPTLRVRDTVALMPTPRGLHVPEIGTWSFAPVRASPLVAVASNGSGIAIAEWTDSEPGVVELRTIDPDGDERWHRSLRLAAPPIPTAVRDSLIRDAAERARPRIERARSQGRGPRGTVEALVERGLSLPRHFAPAGRLRIGLDGTIWLQEMNGLEAADWLVLDAEGRELWRVRVPRGFELHEASRESVWGTEKDDLDVAYMVRLRVMER